MATNTSLSVNTNQSVSQTVAEGFNETHDSTIQGTQPDNRSRQVPTATVAVIWVLVLTAVLGGSLLAFGPSESSVEFTLQAAVAELDAPVVNANAVQWLVSHPDESVGPLITLLHTPLITEDSTPDLIQKNASDVLQRIGRPAETRLKEALANVRQQQSSNKRMTQRIGMFGGSIEPGLHFSSCLLAVERNLLNAMN